VWAFHGGKDPVVPLNESQRMVDYLKKVGVNEVKFTIHPDALHDSWTQTYDNPELYAWFLQHSR
jgi:predicted peptidase